MRFRKTPVALVGPITFAAILPFVASLVLVAGFGFKGSNGPGFDIWRRFLTDPFSWQVIGTTLWLAVRVTVICVVIAYPVAFALQRLRSPVLRGIALTILFTPLLMSVIVRTYGWIVLLSNQGLVNALLGEFGLGPYRLMHNDLGVVLAMVHVMLPFAVLPVLSSISQLPANGVEAARDLGARPLDVFTRVTFPLTLPGAIAAAEIVFALSASAFVTPSIMGGGRVLTLSRLIYDNIGSLDWGLAAVEGVTLLVLTVGILVTFRQFGRIFRYQGSEK